MKIRKSRHKGWRSVNLTDSYIVLLAPTPGLLGLTESTIPRHGYTQKLFEGEIGNLDAGFSFIVKSLKA